MNKKLTKFCWVSWLGLLLVLSSNSLTAYAKGEDPVQQWVKPNVTQKPLKYSAFFQGRGDGVATCPVTGEKITNKNFKADLLGRTVLFCCHGCLKAAKQNPEKFVKAKAAEQQIAVNAYLAKTTQSVHKAEYCDE